ncbi:MAG: cell division protein ZapA [Pseudomonadota bacterium]|nr:cell division protein ZapA [Pseudomonadota bacterium]
MQNGLKVNIMEREYMVSCEENQRMDLLAAASYLDQKMREISGRGKVIGLDRCAIMAALNISHELLQVREAEQQNALDPALEGRLQKLQQRVAGAVEELRQVTI